MQKLLNQLIAFLCLILFLGPFNLNSAEAEGEGQLVYVIAIEQTVEKGLDAFLERAVEEAKENGADYIIFEIDTPGGRVDAALDIGELLRSLDIPNAAYIVNKALSAGAYISLNADEIYMKPGTSIGAAGVITGEGNAADKKTQSAWISNMTAAAVENGRDPIYAQAMADDSIDLPEYRAPEGEYLTLYANEALEVGYAEGIAEDRTALLHILKLEGAQVETVQPTFAEQLARFITDPVVVPILLSIASLGLVLELYTPGFGVPGIMGVLSLLLFFYGHLIAGLAGYESIILIIAGLICIALEFFVPGGILGVIGTILVVMSLLLAGADIGYMAFSIGVAFIISVIASILLFKTIGLERGLFRHIILKDRTSTEEGYVSNANRLELVGKTGRSLTPLRPSGTAVFDDERLDVVTEGSFIPAEKPVKIVKVEGSRIVVREINKDH
ncbi:MAG: nodulation protein NfeD [Bacillaceae bacterium]|nr:nodulation protein NfeD [Bacillaceae bacterium]